MRAGTALVASLLVAVGAPVWWLATRPEGRDGVPVASVGAPASSPSAPLPTAAGDRSGVGLPPMTARPAGPRPVPAPDPPTRVRVPALGVDAPIDPVGVRGRFVQVPEDGARVGWYRYGPAPGSDAGAAVLVGHVDTREQGPGALFRLREVRTGTRIEVVRGTGEVRSYRVVGRETFVKSRLPTERLFARDGDPRLVLITCGGPFDEVLSSYRDNVVVVAEPVPA